MSSGENELIAGRYRVVRQLGRGGMGVVWRAVDEVLGREVAVKELRTYTDSSGHELADLRLRMQREARAAARVRHSGVVSVHDVTEHEGRPVIVMELIDGPSLDDVLSDRGVLDPREAAAVGAKVLEALDAAHAVGVLHRDVKPGNVLLDRGGRVVLTDFGIAAMDDPGDGSTTHLTRSGELVGSLDYLAPERAQGHDPGPASDIWALGATLYAAVEGSSPFRRTSTWSTLTAIVGEPLPEPRRAGPLAPVLQRLMHKDPARRPDAATAARLLTAVAQGREPAPTGPAPYVPTERNVLPHQPQGFGPAPVVPTPAAPAPAAVPAPAAAAPGPSGTRGTRAPAPAPRRAGAGSRPRSRALVAAATAAVLLAGGGVTYALMDREAPATGRESAGGRPGPSSVADASGPGAEQDPGRVLTPGSGPSASAAAPDATPAEPAAGRSTAAAGKPSPSGTGAGGRKAAPGGTEPGGTEPGGTATSGGSAATGGAGEPAPAPACHSTGGGKHDCQVWRTAKSHRADGAEAGVLNAGTNYFYCQANLGRRETHGEWTNVWWARTDDDSGNTGVYVSVVYIRGGDNDRPVPGLPTC
ncbi:serine/threonine-protein kinase [Streptomyces sp. NPDC050856]|uniref:serine/threonine-protein kinase n=1 Tax=Streptomyces sp. NPDC050856 TaxID=3154939 RepID=UPI0033D5FC64